MKTVKNYLKKRKAGLIGYLLFTIVYFGIFALYGVPMDAPVYALIITFTLLVAVVAFRIVNKLLHTLNFTNAPLYMMCTAVAICVFAVFYAIVYAITAREYYKIVN